MRFGWAHSWTIISLNLFLLAVGLCAAYCLLIREFFADKILVLMLSLFFLLFVRRNKAFHNSSHRCSVFLFCHVLPCCDQLRDNAKLEQEIYCPDNRCVDLRISSYNAS